MLPVSLVEKGLNTEVTKTLCGLDVKSCEAQRAPRNCGNKGDSCRQATNEGE